MNELYLILHIAIIIGFTLITLRLGKEALITSFCLQVLLSNLFVTKQMECFGLTVTCTDVFTIGSLFSLNLLQEYFGKGAAKKAIWITFLLLLFYLVMAKLHLLYTPSIFDTKQSAFHAILASSPRIIIVSCCVAFLTDLLDSKLYGFFQARRKKNSLFLRLGATPLITQFLDTFLFSILALYGLVHSMRDIILMSYGIKVAIILIMTPLLSFASKVVRRYDVPA